MNKPVWYQIFQKGLLIATLPLIPEQVKQFERVGYRLKIMKQNPKKLTRKKARTILHHGTVRKHPLTPKQRKFFGARASGVPRKNPKGLVLIYKHVTRIEGTKGNNSAFPGQRFFHNFKRPYPSMYGTPDKKTLVIK